MPIFEANFEKREAPPYASTQPIDDLLPRLLTPNFDLPSYFWATASGRSLGLRVVYDVKIKGFN